MLTPRRFVAALAFSTVISLGVVRTAYADPILIVAPNSLAGTEGNSNLQTDANARLQQVYASSQFSALSGPVYITQIAFRPDAPFGHAFTVTNSGLLITLSSTGKAPDGLSPTFAENVGGNASLVYSGPLTVSSAFTGPLGGPKDFDVIINLQTPFLYDPASGNLLFDIRTSGVFFVLGNQMDSEDTYGDSVSMVAANIGSSSGIPTTQGYVTRFTFQPVPEPTTILLLGAGLLGVAAKARKRLRADGRRHYSTPLSLGRNFQTGRLQPHPQGMRLS
jgi:hypothetical protein